MSKSNNKYVAMLDTRPEQILQNNSTKNNLLWPILKRLYKIRNVANLAAFWPQTDAEVYILQDILELISELTQTAIEEMEQIPG